MSVEIEYKATAGIDSVDDASMYVGAESDGEQHLFIVIRKPYDLRNSNCKGVNKADGYLIVNVEDCCILKNPSSSVWYKDLDAVCEALRKEYSSVREVAEITVESFMDE